MNSGWIILNYHDVNLVAETSKTSVYSIHKDVFEEQLKTISLFSNKGSILLTFDDGYASHFNSVKPLLNKFQIKTIFFPIFSKINSNGYLTGNEIIELKNEGHIIGLHGWKHHPLTHYSMKKLESELKLMLNEFKELTGDECKHFSLPFGEYNSTIISLLKSNGIKFIYTTNGYLNDGTYSNLQNRINMKNNISDKQFRNIISSHGSTLRLLEFKGATNRIRKSILSMLKRKIKP